MGVHKLTFLLELLFSTMIAMMITSLAGPFLIIVCIIILNSFIWIVGIDSIELNTIESRVVGAIVSSALFIGSTIAIYRDIAEPGKSVDDIKIKRILK